MWELGKEIKMKERRWGCVRRGMGVVECGAVERKEKNGEKTGGDHLGILEKNRGRGNRKGHGKREKREEWREKEVGVAGCLGKWREKSKKQRGRKQMGKMGRE